MFKKFKKILKIIEPFGRFSCLTYWSNELWLKEKNILMKIQI